MYVRPIINTEENVNILNLDSIMLSPHKVGSCKRMSVTVEIRGMVLSILIQAIMKNRAI